MSIIIYCDGLCEPRNPGGTAAYGWVAYRDGQKIAEECAVICSGPEATNNIAEYGAIIASLEWLAKHYFFQENIRIKSDSQLCIYQLQGQYSVNSPRIIPLYIKAKNLSKKFKKISFHWVPREKNEEADALSRKAYMENKSGQDSNTTRKQKAVNIVGNIRCVGQNKYEVMSQTTNDVYIVNTAISTCTCPDYIKRQQKIGGKCKHIMAVELGKEKTG